MSLEQEIKDFLNSQYNTKNIRADYTTNSKSYYDYLEKITAILVFMSRKIDEYDGILSSELQNIKEKMDEYLEKWDENLEKFDDSVLILLQEWMDDGTFEHIINHEIFQNKLDTSIFEEFELSVNQQLSETEKYIITSEYDTLNEAIEQLNTILEKKTVLLIDKDYTISETFVITKPHTTIKSINNSIIRRSNNQLSAFSFQADYCTLENTNIISPSGWYGHNSKWQNNEAVVHINGNYFKAINNTIENIYRVGFGVRKANNILFSGNHIIGNYPSSQWTGIESVNHGITLDGGKFTKIIGNTIEHCVNDIFIGRYEGDYTIGVIINDNILNYTFGHAIYCGNDNEHTTITGNTIYNSRGAIACTGGGHAITGNVILFDEKANIDISGTHISLRDSQNCVINGNTIDTINAIGAAGASIAIQSKDKGVLKNNLIVNNTINQKNYAPAIRIIPQNIEDLIAGNIIEGNMITGKSYENHGMITVSGSTVKRAEYNKIRNNSIILEGTNSSGWGIYTPYQKNLLISGNTMEVLFNSDYARNIQLIRFDEVINTTVKDNILTIPIDYGRLLSFFVFNAIKSSNNIYKDNIVFNHANVELVGFNLNDYDSVEMRNNKMSNDKLSGGITTSTQSTVISNKNVTTQSKIIIIPTNNISSNLKFYVNCSNGSFTLILDSVPTEPALFNFIII